MNPLRRIAAVLAVLGAAMLALTASAGSAFAIVLPQRPRSEAVPGGTPPPQIVTVTHTLIAGGMPGWQIALIAAGAALLAATIAVLADRAWSTRRKAVTAAA